MISDNTIEIIIPIQAWTPKEVGVFYDTSRHESFWNKLWIKQIIKENEV